MTDDTRVITKVEADLIIRDRAAEYVDEYGADPTLEHFALWRRGLMRDVGRPLDHEYLADVIYAMGRLVELEQGIHPGLVASRDGIDDNTDVVRSYEKHQLDKDINYLLNLAGFHGGRVNGTGKAA